MNAFTWSLVSPAASSLSRLSGATAAALLSLAVSAPLQAQSAPSGSQLLGVEIFPVNVKPPQPAPEGEPEAREEEAQPEPAVPLKFAFFCFGPVFGNDSREIDPNYMPPPTAVEDDVHPSKVVVPVRYMRVPAIVPDRTTWVGYDGSQISYRSRAEIATNPVRPPAVNRERGNDATANTPSASAAGPQAHVHARANAPKEPSVAELIAENRKEMTRISWERTYRRFPELEREDSPEREAFESYLLKKHADPRGGAAFDSPMWPEATAAAFMAERNWKTAEQESWDRVRSKVRIFNDPESVYTRRFMDFASGLREDPREAGIFRNPDWPEKALELHDQKFGPVPEQFR